MKVLVHHAEIGLKRGNFSFFEKKLVENVRKACDKEKLKLKNISRKNKRILCEFGGKTDKEKIIGGLKNVIGIRYFAFVSEIEKNQNLLEKEIKKIYSGFEKKGIKEIAFKTKRADKKYPLTSQEINGELGGFAGRYGLKFNYSSPEKIIYIEIADKIYLYTKRYEGFGGLPVSTGGKILCLLSGGIDSPVAAWLMMKRGCRVDFLHFHAFQKNSKVFEKNSVVKKIVEKLNTYQYGSKLDTLPYSNYMLNVQGNIFERYDLVIFKHYMMKVAEKLALEKGYKAIVTGDNLSQVASQTLENLKVASQNIKVPIFRPLLGYDKEEIINLSKRLGLYKESIKEYRDCCSIVAKNPSTKTSQKDFEKELDKINFKELVEKSLEEISEKKIG